MRKKLDEIILLAKRIEYHERSAEWFDSGVNDNYRRASAAEVELNAAIEQFVQEYGATTAIES